ncbi:hypothetical protein [Longirhabdus pacifica]|uniref:hypothetical protein n=1 Tax=Longirhabdus pacifica TaxID=2305227 RepID=UPI0010087128|nr:hypothetical protein [Longirhabdus pacifica]
MNLKPIELQVTLSRMQDAAHHQKNSNDKPVLDQERLAMQVEKEQRLAKEKSVEVDETDHAMIRDNQQQQGKDNKDNVEQKEENEEDKKEEEQAASHPFKGKHVDLSL